MLLGGLTAVCYLSALALWPSDTQRAKRAVSGLLNALEKGRTGDVMTFISPYFSEEGVDRQMLGGMLGEILKQQDIIRTSVTFRQIQVIHGRAVMKVHVRSFHRGEFGGGMAHSDWIVGLEELGGKWLVREATPLSVNDRKVGGLRAILAAGY
jgi:hypothetical protein